MFRPFPVLSYSKGTSWASRRSKGRLGGGSQGGQEGASVFEIFWQTTSKNPQLTASKLENSEQKNILPEKTPKIVCNLKTLNLKTL